MIEDNTFIVRIFNNGKKKTNQKKAKITILQQQKQQHTACVRACVCIHVLELLMYYNI